jgi:shikimate kinase
VVNNLVLVGFSASGKTTIGRILSRRLRLRFVDTDRYIEQSTGRTIPDIFREDGEEAFRQMERDAIVEIAGGRFQVISTGGGAFLSSENQEVLREGNLVVHLRVRPETVMERIKSSHGARPRPLLQVEDPLGRIREMMADRKPAYAQAHIALDVDDRTTYAVAADVVHHWYNWRRTVRNARTRAAQAVSTPS